MDESTLSAALKREVLKGKNFRGIDETLVERVICAGAQPNESFKERVARARSKLHQTCNAFRGGNLDYSAVTDEIRHITPEMDPSELKTDCRRWMGLHASTRERLPILKDFYDQIFRRLPEIHSVLDLASGLNPLALPWMPLSRQISYAAWDVYADMAGLLNTFFRHSGYINARAFQGNLLNGVPQTSAELTLLLKTIPCLEQVEKNAGARILSQICSPFAVISFPIFSLSGKQKGMKEHYGGRFLQLVDSAEWDIERMLFENELVFLLKRKER